MRRKKTPDGYRSKAEAKFAKFLKENGIKFAYEKTKFKYVKPASLHTYLPDFKCKKTFIEFKGRFTPADRKKMILVRDQHPGLDIRLVFMQNNTLSKVSKTTYSDWAEKNDFIYHVGVSIPESWIKELK
jgi:hypothetical protein